MPRGKWPLLNREWKVGARHGAYHVDGTFFEHLQRFPGALFDAHGYVLFLTQETYENYSQLHLGQKINVPNGISNLPGYVRVKD